MTKTSKYIAPQEFTDAADALAQVKNIYDSSIAHLREALQHAVPALSEARYPELVERYRHHYLSRDHELQLFHGVAELIAELSAAGFLLAVATGKSRLGLDRALHVPSEHCAWVAATGLVGLDEERQGD